MFSVVFNGEVKGLCDEPNYVKQKDGIWINCNKSDHEAIAIGGVAYEGAIVKQHDGGDVVFGQGIALDEAAGRIELNASGIDGLAEIVEIQNEALNDLATAINELG